MTGFEIRDTWVNLNDWKVEQIWTWIHFRRSVRMTLNAHAHAHTHTRTRTRTHTRTHAHTHTHTPTRTHARTYTYAYVHISKHTCVISPTPSHATPLSPLSFSPIPPFAERERERESCVILPAKTLRPGWRQLRRN